MARTSNDVYEDVKLSPEEQAAYDASMSAPEPLDDDGGVPLEEDPKAKDVQPAAAPEPKPDPIPEPDAPADLNDDEKLKAFVEANKGKSPEEILKLAFQQQQRANKSAFESRKTAEQIQAIRDNAAAVLAQRKADIENRRNQFKTKLNEDPDEAALLLHEQQLTAEERQAEIEAHNAKLDAAIMLASTAIPDFQNNYHNLLSFGAEMNYTPEELASVADGRDLVVLHLASLAGNLIKSGIMDVRGQMLKLPQAVESTDPRLDIPKDALQSLGGAGRKVDDPGSVETQLANLLNLSEADFAKVDPALLENLLKQAN